MATGFRTDIQGLRALAVMLVLFYHAGFDWLSGGYIGVDVFYVISGYLITGILLKEYQQNQSINLFEFYARRVRRLFPAAALVIVTTALFAWYVFSPLKFKIFTSSAISAILYLSNFWFAAKSTDYLAENTDADPLLHTWSLGVEEQFYVVWPLFLVFLLRHYGRTGDLRILTFGISGLLIVSFVASVFLTAYSQPWAFFASPTRAWEFCAGALLAVQHNKADMTKSSVPPFAFYGGVALVFFSAFSFDEQTLFPGYIAAIPVVGTCLILSAANQIRPSFLRAAIDSRPTQFIGDVSYSLYLWHWPVFLFLGAHDRDGGWHFPIVGIVLSFFLAAATYFTVENPIRRSRFFSTKLSRSWALGLSLTLCSLACLYIARGLVSNELQSPEQRVYVDARNDLPRLYQLGCHLDFFQTELTDCVFGNKNGDSTMILFGDSHAAQWFPAFEVIAESLGWKLLSMTKSSCPSVPFASQKEFLGRPYNECTEWRARVVEFIRETQPELIIVSNSSGYLMDHPDNQDPKLYREWQAGVQNTLSILDEFAGTTIVIADNPRLDFNAPECLSRAAWKKQDHRKLCSLPVQDEMQQNIFALERDVVESYDSVFSLVMNDLICPKQNCPVMSGTQVLYSDSNHLTSSYVTTLSGVLKERLRKYGIEVK